MRWYLLGVMRLRPVIASVVHLLLAVYVYTAMEWLFILTQRSFLADLSLVSQLQILFLTALAFAGATLPCQLAAAVLYGLALPLERRWPRLRASVFLAAPPAAILAALGLLLVDNFTYTLTGFGIVKVGLVGSLVYCGGLLAAFLVVVRWSAGWMDARRPGLPWTAGAPAVLLVALSLAVTGWLLRAPGGKSGVPDPWPDNLGRDLPNVVFLAADGIDADHLPLYGYPRATTPVLDRYTGRALVVENTFTNAVRTTGSLTSMLTGKLPTTTRVFFPPHALSGADAFEHLPGILKRLGYTSLQETARYYADGPDLNMRRAFDVANRRLVDEGTSILPARILERVPSQQLFSQRVEDRITERLLHISRVRPMVDHYGMVTGRTEAKVYGFSDRGRVERVLTFMEHAPEPFFVHLQLMESHCCHFQPEVRFFSARYGPQQPVGEDADYYDDVILSSDLQLGRILQWLEQRSKLDRTVVVYSSDHTVNWGFQRRVPLWFLFPGGEHAGRIAVTAQLVDVAPTVLDYLGVQVPDWMEGRSLLRTEQIDPQRPIFIVTDFHRERFLANDESLTKLVGEGPPLYGLKTFSLTRCNRWYTMVLESGEMSSGEVPGHTRPCPESTALTEAEARGLLIRHLESRGLRLPFAQQEANGVFVRKEKKARERR